MRLRATITEGDKETSTLVPLATVLEFTDAHEGRKLNDCIENGDYTAWARCVAASRRDPRLRRLVSRCRLGADRQLRGPGPFWGRAEPDRHRLARIIVQAGCSWSEFLNFDDEMQEAIWAVVAGVPAPQPSFAAPVEHPVRSVDPSGADARAFFSVVV